MKNAILGLRTVTYKVSDMAAANEWFSKAFSTAPYFNEPFYIGYNIGGYELGLQPEEDPLSIKGNNSITYWGVEDIESAYAGFISLGATEHEAPQNVGGDIMVASVYDLWGNIIGLIYNPHFKLP